MSYSLLAVNQDLDTTLSIVAYGKPFAIKGRFDSIRFNTASFSRRLEPRFIVNCSTSAEPSRGSHSHLDLADRVRQAVSDVLSEGVPTLSSIASKLGIGTRTLQRHLSVSGHSFQGIVDLTRKNHAQRLLRETNHSLAEVAFLTGFSEQSGFTRAFKRWAGQTPRSYRLEACSQYHSGSKTNHQNAYAPTQACAARFSYQLNQ